MSTMGKRFTSVHVNKFRVGHAGVAFNHHQKRAANAGELSIHLLNPTDTNA